MIARLERMVVECVTAGRRTLGKADWRDGLAALTLVIWWWFVWGVL